MTFPSRLNGWWMAKQWFRQADRRARGYNRNANDWFRWPTFSVFCTHLAISQCYSNLKRISQSLAMGSINALCNSHSPYGNMFPGFPLCSRDPWTGGLPESRRVHWSTCGLMEWKTALWWMSTFRLGWVVYKILNLQRCCFSNLFIDAISLDLPPHP